MKIRFLIILLLLYTSANADDSKGQSADKQSTEKVETIRIEKKVTPTTTWIENLVKPLTVWMEQQINGPEQKEKSQEVKQENSLINEQEGTLNLNQTVSENILDPDLLIGSEQAGILAKEHIAGDVLYIKLISRTKQYRVKLISKLGEIHNIYIQAISGEIVSPNNKALIEPVKQGSTKQRDDNKESP